MIKTLKELERGLGYKVMDNITCLGVDTATTAGLSLLTINKGKITLKTDIIKLPAIPKKIADQLEKAEKYEKALRSAVELIRAYKKTIVVKSPSILVLEQSFLLMNPETYGYLRSLGGIYYSELFDLFDSIKIYLPTVARKIVGFHSTLPRSAERKDKKNEICEWISNVIKSPITNDNIADALLLSLAGIKK